MANLEGWLEAHARQEKQEREQQHGQHGCVHDQGEERKGKKDGWLQIVGPEWDGVVLERKGKETNGKEDGERPLQWLTCHNRQWLNS